VLNAAKYHCLTLVAVKQLPVHSTGTSDVRPRASCMQSAPQKVITSIMNVHEGIKDDTSLVIVDLLPPGKAFSECTRSFAGSMSCNCMCVALFRLPI
jgi:hypothetical protein